MIKRQNSQPCRLAFASVSLVMLLATCATADGLFYQLPAAGTSATYQFVAEELNADQKPKLTGTIKMSSVGKTMVDGEPGRWIEVAFNFDPENKARAVKLHILDKHLTRQTRQFDHVIEAWSNAGPRARKFDPNTLSPRLDDMQLWKFLLCGVLNDAKRLTEVEVEHGDGKLLCIGHSGSISLLANKTVSNARFESRLNESVPFGYVAGTVNIQQTRDGKFHGGIEFDLKLVETASDAKSIIDHESALEQPEAVLKESR